MTPKTMLPYDIASAESIFEYSKGLLGKTLRDFVWEDCVNNLFSTNGLHTLQENQSPKANHIDTNLWNLQTGFSLGRIPANEWSVECLQENEYTLARCLGHFSVFQSLVPRLSMYVPSNFFRKITIFFHNNKVI